MKRHIHTCAHTQQGWIILSIWNVKVLINCHSSHFHCKDGLLLSFISARLPFKRLNLAPKEKTKDGSDNTRSSPSAPAQSQVPDVETSLDNLENNFHMGSDIDFRPKLVNGKGPLDNFLKNRVKTSIGETTVIIDLTEDSSDQPDDISAYDKLNPAACPSLEEAVNKVREEAGDEGGLPKASQKDELTFSEETLLDIPCKTEEEGAGSGGTERRGDAQEAPQSCPKLTDGPRTCSEKDQDGWSEAGGILFKGKVPVVLLQDILSIKPGATSPAIPLDQGTPSRREVLESSHGEDSVLSHSSLSSSSPTSSPEGWCASKNQHNGPSAFPTLTPVRRVSISPNPSVLVLMVFLVQPLFIWGHYAPKWWLEAE